MWGRTRSRPAIASNMDRAPATVHRRRPLRPAAVPRASPCRPRSTNSRQPRSITSGWWRATQPGPATARTGRSPRAPRRSRATFGLRWPRARGRLSCPRRRHLAARFAAAATAKARTGVRTLWARDNRGRFSTRGENSIATVRGTYWETVDRCDGTLTVVAKGAVSVRDIHRHHTVLLRAGRSYLA